MIEQSSSKLLVPHSGLSLIQEAQNILLEDKSSIIYYEHILSEEAVVWRLSTDTGQVIAWLKQHKTKAKAQSEKEAIQRWGKSISSINTPKVIAHSDDYLLLSHCKGQVKRNYEVQDLEQIAQFLFKLHDLTWIDQDSLTLQKALYRRSISISKQEKALKKTLKTQAPAYLDIFVELQKRVQQPAPLGTHNFLKQRCPCHRDIRLDHLLFTRQAIHPNLSVIDWGQSRSDHWSSDWTKICLESRQAPTIWKYYWRDRLNKIKLNAENRRSISQMLHWALSLHTLNTLKWAYLHRESSQETIISAKTKHKNEQALNHQVWQRALDELALMNNFKISEFTL